MSSETAPATIRTAHGRRSIRNRLIWSHLVAVTASTFVYAGGGFILVMMLLIGIGGYTAVGIRQLAPEFAGLTAFVLAQILLITLCGLIVARIASSIVSRPMLRQIAELEAGSIDVANGNLGRRVPVSADDELGQLARRFNFLAERLDESERQRQAFVANVSHDLRTPIAIIRGHLDAQLAEGSDVVIPIATSLAAIDHEIRTLSELVNDLFTHSRLEDGMVPVQSIPVDLTALVERSVMGIRAYALTHARVSVHAQGADALPLVIADATKTTQVINNLLHNAIRHTPEGGVVVAQVGPDQDGLRVTIRDTGVGIEPDKLAHVFDRYYQAGSSSTEGGSGLGLSIVKRLVELQGGRVGIESDVGVGTSVWFTLPVGRPDHERTRGRIRGIWPVP